MFSLQADLSLREKKELKLEKKTKETKKKTDHCWN